MKKEEIRFAHRFDQVSGSAIREIFKIIAQPGMISFAGGNPSLAALPDVTGVQFLIEGEPRQSLIHPHFDQVIMPRTPGAIFRTEEN